jgi:putative redox protein
MRSAVARRRKGYEHEVEIREHRLIVDEPEASGGSDAGPTPTELLAASLAACSAVTIEMYADRKQWDLGQVEVSVDWAGEDSKADSPSFEVKIRTPAELDDEQRKRVLVIAGKCPVHRALEAQDVEINDSLEQIEA